MRRCFTVVNFVMTPTAGCVQIPAILAGQTAPSDSRLGTKNYGTVPAAVVLGGGYNDSGIEEMMKAASQNGAAKAVPWLRPDLTIPTPPLGPEYGKAMVQRLKKVLAELQVDGRLNAGTNVYWY
jgi:hypothetical protein